MKSKFAVAHQQMSLEVGATYSVAHAVIRLRRRYHNIPIIPIRHSDPELGVSGAHYHIDGRFEIENKKVQSLFRVVRGKTGIVVTAEIETDISMFGQIYQLISLAYLDKQCIRLDSGIPAPVSISKYVGVRGSIFMENRYIEWYKKYIGRSCAGRKCPHMGSIMFEKNGHLVCPLHNLHGDIEKEVIIEY